MRVEFRQGVPEGCTEWLWDNVGPGNVESGLTFVRVNGIRDFLTDSLVDTHEYAWFYQRECVYPQPHEAFDPRDLGPKYVPTITVKDPKLATWFVLRWS